MELVELLLVEELLLDEVDELLLEDDDPVPGVPSLASLQPMLKEPSSSKQTICEILGMFPLFGIIGFIFIDLCEHAHCMQIFFVGMA